MSQTPTQNPSPTLNPSLPTGEAGAAHLDDIDLTGLDPVELDAQAEGEGMPEGVGADGFVSFDVWFLGFRVAHQLAGQTLQLETLAKAPELPTAEPAARAIYDTACETPYLHFLVKPGSVWLQRALVIGAYVLPVAAGCREEMAARQAKPVEPSPDRAAPPDTGPNPEPYTDPKTGKTYDG